MYNLFQSQIALHVLASFFTGFIFAATAPKLAKLHIAIYYTILWAFLLLPYFAFLGLVVTIDFTLVHAVSFVLGALSVPLYIQTKRWRNPEKAAEELMNLYRNFSQDYPKLIGLAALMPPVAVTLHWLQTLSAQHFVFAVLIWVLFFPIAIGAMSVQVIAHEHSVKPYDARRIYLLIGFVMNAVVVFVITGLTWWII